MSDRDYLAEMNAACRAALDATEDPAPVVAGALVERLRSTDPGLLDGWLRTRERHIVAEHLGDMVRSTRQADRRSAGPRAFDKAARSFGDGDSSALGAFRAEYNLADGTRRKAGDMTGPDHLFVASGYRTDSKRAAFLARVHEKVAKLVGDRKTSDVLSEEKYAAMFGSPVKAADKAPAA